MGVSLSLYIYNINIYIYIKILPFWLKVMACHHHEPNG